MMYSISQKIFLDFLVFSFAAQLYDEPAKVWTLSAAVQASYYLI